MRRARLSEEQLRHVAAWRGSGQTAYGYARAHGLSQGSLKRWAEHAERASAPSFAKVEVVPKPAVGTALVVRVGRTELVVGSGFDAELLRRVVQALT